MRDATEPFRAAIHSALGNAPEVIQPGRFQRFGTSHRRGDTAGWCKLFDDMRAGVFGCYRQGISEVWSATGAAIVTREQRAELARQGISARAERQALQRRTWAENARRIARLWADCLTLRPGDPVTLYLERRGLSGAWSQSEMLRLHPALPYWEGANRLGIFPAMVAPIVAPDGRMVALHRTYLTADGRKADVPNPKKVTGASGSLVGACIPLHKPARGCIAIAEGVETALATWSGSSVPTVAAYCAGALAAWQWPAGVQRLVIFADNDRAGREAADKLRARALAARLRCDVLTPSNEGADWCDVWAERGALLAEVGVAA